MTGPLRQCSAHAAAFPLPLHYPSRQPVIMGDNMRNMMIHKGTSELRVRREEAYAKASLKK